ncbi:MAG: hypothetical protein D6812_16315, partial [Deltaproteobacteria bacterium]
MSRARVILPLLLVIFPVLGMAEEAFGDAEAFRLDGQRAKAYGNTVRAGDIVLRNDAVEFVISGAGHAQGFAISGGNIVHAVDRRREGPSSLKQIFTFFDDTFPRQAVYETVEIVGGKEEDGAVVVEARGYDSQTLGLTGDPGASAPKIAVVTRYRLPRRGNVLEISTVLRNEGKETIVDFELGDALQWGSAEHFAPGVGFDLAGKRPAVPWVAAADGRRAYGWTSKAEAMPTISGSGWTDVDVSRVTLPPGGSATYTRYLVVGQGDVASVLPAIHEIRGTPFGTLTGDVREEGGNPLPGVTVSVESAPGKPYATAMTDGVGHYMVALPPGNYQAVAFSVNHPRGTPREAAIEADASVRIDFTLPPAGGLAYRVTDRQGRPIPAKLTVLGVPPTATPDLGPPFQAQAAGNTILSLTGSGRRPFPVGTYEFIASHGPEYSIDRKRATIVSGETTALSFTLEHEVASTGFLSGDFHVHAINSADSATPLRDRVISNIVEGVEILVATDHDFITDYRPVIAALDAERWITSVIGDEVTTRNLGHFNAFPLDLRPDLPGNGALDHTGLTPAQIFSALRRDPGEEILQVNHPRAGQIGYFNHFSDALAHPERPAGNFSLDFDAIEVINGKRTEEARAVIEDWFRLLDRGMRFTATGNSDTHRIVGQEAGYARNFVMLPTDEPAALIAEELIEAVARHRVVASTGPLIRFSIDGMGLGETVTDTDGAVELDIEIESASWIPLSRFSIIGNGERFFSL